MQQAALGVSSTYDEADKSDPAEEELRDQMEAEKKRYKTHFSRLKSLKTEIEHLQLLLEKAKVKVQKDFEDWWSQEASELQNHPEVDMRSSPSPFSQHPHSIFKNATNSSSSFERPESGHRASRGADTPIPLTGDSQTDADILAFVRARQNLLNRKGSGHQ
ncbi:kinesin-like protein KIF6 [Hyla sarda]|uniref:kinesin-like protein KIF6 n=1 Tax=Hyla sarda TaxID=327740 RepID=UPI0024C434EC|nr:kinesin-like protein KIF6 [Hyla sarda]